MTDVGLLVERTLGVRPANVEATASPDAWFAELLDGRHVVIKLPRWRNRPGSAHVEAWIYSECRRRGIGVPRVLALSDDPECLVTERLSGAAVPDAAESLTRADRAIWARAGEAVRALHEVRMEGFGPLRPGPGQPRGEADRWCPFAESARVEGIPWLVDAGHLTQSAATALLRRFDDAEPVIDQVTDGRLLHGDLQAEHIFRSASGRFEGIIDFGQAQAGDPRWDLARIRLWDGDDALDAFLDGYGTTLTRDERELLLPLYLVAFVVGHAAGHGRPDYIRLILDRSGYRQLL